MIDINAQADGIGIDRAALIKMYELFISSTRNNLIELKEMYRAKKWDQIKSILHHIKGAAAALEQKCISELASSLENRLSENETESASEVIPVIQGIETSITELESTFGSR
jgi:HPt (histidine-containing phosphotransfer) domain-containing protein